MVGVLVLYTDASAPGTWASVELSSADGQNWSGTGASTPSGKAQYLVEAVDAAGNVSVSNNEGVDFNSQAQTTTSLSSSANPSAPSAPVSFTAAVASAVTALGGPTGSVEFLDEGVPVAACGGTSGEALSGTLATCEVDYSTPGLHEITAEYTGDPNFASSTTSQALAETVQQPQAVTFTGPSLGLTGTSAALSATGGASGNPVVFSVDATSGAGACTVSGVNGTTLNYTGAGTCTIDANQVGGGYYLPAPQVQWLVTVVQGPPIFANAATLTVPAGSAFSFPVTTTASSDLTALSESGTLPAGVTFSGGLAGGPRCRVLPRSPPGSTTSRSTPPVLPVVPPPKLLP